MAWNEDKPGNDEKIRNLGTVIRANWDAILKGDENTDGVTGMLEQYSVQLANRSDVASSADPTVNEGTHYIYAKEDDEGNQEAFMQDSDGNDPIQVTQGGLLGSDVTDIGFDTISPDQGTNVFNEFNFVTHWGIFDQNGATIGTAYGITCSAPAPSSGLYTISFDSDVTSANYAVFITPLNTSNNPHSVKWNSPTVSNFKIGIQNQNGTSITDDSFCVMVLGGITA